MKKRIDFCHLAIIFSLAFAQSIIAAEKSFSSELGVEITWIKKNPIATSEFADPIKAESDRKLLGDSIFGDYHLVVIDNEEIWAIAISKLEVISMIFKPVPMIKFRAFYKGNWREWTSFSETYQKLLLMCKKLDI